MLHIFKWLSATIKRLGQNCVPLLFVLVGLTVNGQDKKSLDFNTGVDFCSRYVWRGLLFSDAPNLQPHITVSKGGFSALAWASYATSKNYAEIDLFLAYGVGSFTFNLNDYYSENEQDLGASNFSCWKRDQTNHLIEASINYVFPAAKFPLQLTLSSFVYGADLDENGHQNYSAYVEANYPFNINQYNCSLFMGCTTHSGYYANGFGLVNLGMGATVPLKITDTFSVPMSSSLIFNPYRKDVFFVLNFSIN